MVRDAHGRKMSKSLGNVIDPIEVIQGIGLEELHQKLREGNLPASEVQKAIQGQKSDFPDGIEECGTDALRLTLLQYQAQGRDLNLDIKRVVANRHWCNKLWNAIRFALLNLGADFAPPSGGAAAACGGGAAACRWILSRTAAVIDAVDRSYREYEFGEGVQFGPPHYAVRVGGSMAEITQIERSRILPLDHARSVPRQDASLRDEAAEKLMSVVSELVKAVRGMREDYGLLREKSTIFIKCSNPALLETLHTSEVCDIIACLSTSDKVTVGEEVPDTPGSTCVINDSLLVKMELNKTLLDKEAKRLKDKKTNLENQQSALVKAMTKPGYDKAPVHVRTADSEKAERLRKEIESVIVAIQDLNV